MRNQKVVNAVKKPIPVKAYQVDEKTKINTLEGPLYAQPGDWIITGVEGEQWPVKKEIFEKTYKVIDRF